MGYLINTIHEPAGALASTTTMFGGLSQAQYRTDVDGSVFRIYVWSSIKC